MPTITVLIFPSGRNLRSKVVGLLKPCAEAHSYWARTPQTHHFVGLTIANKDNPECAEGVVPGVCDQ